MAEWASPVTSSHAWCCRSDLPTGLRSKPRWPPRLRRHRLTSSHRTQAEASGWFWIAHGLHRYEVGELERWLPAIRIPDGAPFPWGLPPPGLGSLATSKR